MHYNDFGLTAPVRQAAIFVTKSKQITNPAREQLLRARAALFPEHRKENDQVEVKSPIPPLGSRCTRSASDHQHPQDIDMLPITGTPLASYCSTVARMLKSVDGRQSHRVSVEVSGKGWTRPILFTVAVIVPGGLRRPAVGKVIKQLRQG